MNETYFAQLTAKLNINSKQFDKKFLTAVKKLDNLRKMGSRPISLQLAGDTGGQVKVVATSFNNLNKRLESSISLTSKFNESLASQQTAINTQATQIDKLRARMEKLEQSTKKAAGSQKVMQSSLKMNTQQLQDFDKMMTIALQKLIRYRMIFYVGQAVVKGYSGAIKTVTKASYEMAQIQKVMTDEMFKSSMLWKIAEDSSLKYGQSITDTIRGMKVWAQQGRDVYEIQKLHEATMLGSATANITALESVEALTAATKAYKVNLEDLTGVVDIWMNVQAKHAVTAKDLANALKIVANAAQLVGVDMQSLAANVTAVVSVTRKSGTAVANSLKTIFSRFSRPVAQNAFQRLNIDTKEAIGVLRDFDDVMEDLYVRWDNLNDVQRIGIAYSMGGVRRYADFTALLENYGEKLQATANAYTAEGAAARALSIEMDTLKKKMDQISAVTSKIGLGAGSVFISSFDWLATTILALDKSFRGLDKTIGKILGTFGVFIAIMAGLFIVRSLSRMLVSFGHNIIENTVALQGQTWAAQVSRVELVALGHQYKVITSDVTAANISLVQQKAIIDAVNAKQLELAVTSTTAGKAMRASFATAFAGPMAILTALTLAFSLFAYVRSNVKQAQQALSDQNLEIIRNYELTGYQTETLNVYLRKLSDLEEQVKSYDKTQLGARNGAREIREAMLRNAKSFKSLSDMVYQTEGSHIKLFEGVEKVTDAMGLEELAMKRSLAIIAETRKEIMIFYDILLERHEKYKKLVIDPIPEDIKALGGLISEASKVEDITVGLEIDEAEMEKRINSAIELMNLMVEKGALPTSVPMTTLFPEIKEIQKAGDRFNRELQKTYDTISPKAQEFLGALFEDGMEIHFGLSGLKSMKSIMVDVFNGTEDASDAAKKLLRAYSTGIDIPLIKLNELRKVIVDLSKYGRAAREAAGIKRATGGFDFISEEFLEKMVPVIDRFNVKVNALATNVDLSGFKNIVMDEFEHAMSIDETESERWVEDAALSIRKAYRTMTEKTAEEARKRFLTMPTVNKYLEGMQEIVIPELKMRVATGPLDQLEERMGEYILARERVADLHKRIAAGEGKDLYMTFEELLDSMIKITDETYGYSRELEKATQKLYDLRVAQRERSDEEERGANFYKQHKKTLENSLQLRIKEGAALEEQLAIKREIIQADFDAALGGKSAVSFKEYEQALRNKDNALALLEIDRDRLLANAELVPVLGEQANVIKQSKGVHEYMIKVFELANVPLKQQKQTLIEIIEEEHRLAMVKAGGVMSEQNQAKINRQSKLDVLDTKIIYEAILSDVKEVSKQKFKQASIEKSIYQTLGKVVGLTKGGIKEKQLHNELKFRQDILTMHKRDISVAKDILRSHGWTKDELANIADFNDIILRDEQKIRDINKQITMAPLLNDLALVEKYLKNTISLYEDVATGIAEGLGGVPDAIEDMYKTREDYLKTIAEREDEIAKIRAGADPGTDNYRTQLELADRMQDKVNQAKKDVEEMTSVLATTLSVIGSIGESIADTYNEILQDFFAAKITEWLKTKMEISFEGQILSASEQGAEKFYDAITKAVDEKMLQMRDIYGSLLTDAERATLDPLISGGTNAELNAAFDALNASTMNMIAAANYLRYGKALPAPSEKHQPGTPEWFAAKDAENMVVEQKGMRADWAGYVDYLGVIIGTAISGGKPGGAMGAQVGGLAGQFAASQIISAGLSSILPGIGGILGGLIGPLFATEKKELDLEVEALNENTDALKGNTRAVEQLTERLINAPASFTIPALANIGGGGGMSRQASLSGVSRKYLL